MRRAVTSALTLAVVGGAVLGAGLDNVAREAERVPEVQRRTLRSAWQSPDAEGSYCVAWADYDGDGDPDLAVGDKWDIGLNRIYRNDGGTLLLAWTAPQPDATESHGLAWADWDGDGDLDLAVGNEGQPNRVYANQGGELAPVWESFEADATMGVSWADYDGDGDLDLACANKGANRLYENVAVDE